MPGSNLLTLLDDIATILDDVAAMSKVAAKKTAGVLGDDLALNAEQVSGVRADQELPVVWAVAKGSLKNKVILVPAALAISALIPWMITPLLMLGGAFLCYEGFEKLAHKIIPSHSHNGVDHHAKATEPKIDITAKIQGAIRTDFILSAEIIVITLGSVATAPLAKQVIVLAAIAFIMTIGVYGLVAGIVKLDDAGLYLNQKNGESLLSKLQRSLGQILLQTAPYLMKGLSSAGTVAMFMVGGSIVIHGIPGAHEWIHDLVQNITAMPALDRLFGIIFPALIDVLAGIVIGAAILMGASGIKRALIQAFK